MLGRSQHLEQPRRAHAAADAHGGDDIFGAAALAFDQRVAGEARARHAVGVADRDGAAVDVEDVVGDAELVAAVEHLDRERLVQFPQADVVHLEAEALEQLGHREHRADAHLVGLGAGDRHADVAAERLEPALLGERGVHHDAGGRAVAKLAGVAGGDVGAGAQHRLKRGEAFERRVGAVALVLVDA